MINFREIEDKISEQVHDFIGSEFYHEFDISPFVDTISYRGKFFKPKSQCLVGYGLDDIHQVIRIASELGLKYKKVFTVNNIDDKFQTLPLGILDKDNHDFSVFQMIQDERKRNHTPSKLVYANFTVKPERQLCIDAIEKSRKINLMNQENSIIKINMNTNFWMVKTSLQQYQKYIDEILDSQFVLCPEGNGLDTYRFWETLYLGRIPVVTHNHVVDSFPKLPILVIDTWNEMFEKMLQFIDNFNIDKYSFEELDREYWENKIKFT